jgi:hypothetical protein
MWQLENQTPFAAERSFVRDMDGAEVWLVAVKGTFAIKPNGELDLAEEQLPVCLSPRYLGEPGKSSLLYDTDLVHTKPGTDVVLLGRVYAPGGYPTPTLDVTMRVGELEKTLRVFGDRHWKQGLVGLKLTDPEPFDVIPIIYERAYGGADRRSSDPAKHSWDPRNPVGVGFAVEPEHLVGQPAPNVEYKGELISSWRQRPRPAGFGPIARDWSPRVELGGTYDQKWQDERQPLLPLDFDERYYQCAPQDQQLPGTLRGGERVELINLTPGGVLSFALPRVYLAFTTFFGLDAVGHRARLHTVILEPDHPRVVVVWHTSLPCHGREHELEMTRIVEKQFI